MIDVDKIAEKVANEPLEEDIDKLDEDMDEIWGVDALFVDNTDWCVFHLATFSCSVIGVCIDLFGSSDF